MENILTATNREELRQWLLENHDKEKERRTISTSIAEIFREHEKGIMHGEWNDNGRLLNTSFHTK